MNRGLFHKGKHVICTNAACPSRAQCRVFVPDSRPRQTYPHAIINPRAFTPGATGRCKHFAPMGSAHG